MNEVVERALRALADAGIGTREPEQAKPGRERKPLAQAMPDREARKPEREAGALPELPDSILTARYPLAALCRATLAASKLTGDERRWLAEHLEAAVLKWLAHVLKPEPAWDAVCPTGHAVTDGVFARVLLGWCCPECEQVYPAGECRLHIGEGQ